MKLPELALLYVLIGAGSAAGFLVVNRPLSPSHFVDAALLGAFWPLYGPFLMLQSRPHSETDLSKPSLANAPLSSLLPDPNTARALEQRLVLAKERVIEIDRLLSLPEFSDEAARARKVELEERGDGRAAIAAHQRLQSIRRLIALRERFSDELTEISEILAQFRIQAEVVRLAGEDNGQATRKLISELQLRMEALDEMLVEESLPFAP